MRRFLTPNIHSKLSNHYKLHSRSIGSFSFPTTTSTSFRKITCHFQHFKFPRYSSTSLFVTRANFSSLPSNKNNSKDANKVDVENDNASSDDSIESQYQNDYEGIDAKTRKEMQKRHQGIEMNSSGLSQFILPGEYVVKTNKKTGDMKMVSIERSLGYFWYIRDLRDSNDKPVISNSKLIPTDIAQVFPPLGDIGEPLVTLSDEQISLPRFFTRNNRSMDESARCTLVAVHFNAYGSQLLPSWTKPFEETFLPKGSNRVEIVHLSIQEGYSLRFLRHIIHRGYQKNVADADKGTTAIYFGNCPELRDVLRMHNNKTAYVYLLDGIGRVRFAGSGTATQDDIDLMLKFAKELAPGLKDQREKKR